ncbi:chitobiosyldiphosphodolichol beta-mannosyltransferase isoform X2 [Lampris incognitus]|uniref:chitobiosyldiphosphodolichol beta-mannosyltransferase isoform X2 n=1 Tax=Lampris incognitus TaxID=2546036 RepID=UPI0024B61B03|nr:chitobiosyldiphosphodolichol beta-mannosyltransferase isoform X2 [Lampris incognitus]
MAGWTRSVCVPVVSGSVLLCASVLLCGSASRLCGGGALFTACCSLLCAACACVWTIRATRRLRRRDARAGRRACVLVLGDVGRSPRMQYHALSLSRHGYDVTVLGLAGTRPHQDLLTDGRIQIVPIAEVKGIQGPAITRYVTKVVLQCLQLLQLLMKISLQSHVLLQNPPGLPSILVTWYVCRLRGSKFIIDWHNYGYTIMALSHGQRHPIVRMAKWYEHFFGRLADESVCVTNAMRDDLQMNWGIKATTLYDKPPAIFRETPLERRHELFMRLARTYPQFQTSGVRHQDDAAERTVFSSRDLTDNTVTLTPGRPVLLISSTSWTEDEDFSVLLEALQEYEGFVGRDASLPPLVCVITGKGPQKEHYRKLIDTLHFEHVKICTPWLEAEDYPVLLGSADLGVCLHKSSSGLDLPMKVVDMFGCCLPVCAIHFDCLHELVKHDENGLIFKTAEELAKQLKSLFSDFPSDDGRLGWFRNNLRTSGGQRWDENWDQNVLPLIGAAQ